MKKNSQKILSVVLLIAWMAMEFYLSGIPHLSSGLSQDFLLRKVAHVSVFAVLTWLTFHAGYLNIRSFQNKKRALAIATFFFVLVYAASDEYHQHFVTGRQGHWQDVAIDTIGILGMLILLYGIPRLQRFSVSSGKGTK